MAAKPSEWKAVAEEMGLSWVAVKAQYDELRRAEYDARWYGWHLRYRVGQRYGVPNLGILKRRYRDAFESGDRDQLPGFDVVASGLAEEFPELASNDDPAEALWEIIAAPWDDMPMADQTWQEAIDHCLEHAADESGDMAELLEFELANPF